MASLEALPRPRQLALLRRAAREALSRFDVDARRLRLLRYVRNAVFRVELPRGAWLVLRIYRAEHQDPRRAHLEARLLQHLGERSSIQAPRPVRTTRGAFLLEFRSRALQEPAFAVVLKPVRGRHPPIERPSARTVEASGSVLAEIHALGRSMRLPPRLRRPHADWGPLAVHGARLPTAARTHLGAGASRELQRRMDRAARLLSAVGRDRIGVLHGDFHQGNYLLHRGAVRPIDFADCAVGPLVCDVATAVTALAARPGYAVKRAGLLRGYRRLGEIPRAEEEALDALVAARVGISLGHVFGRPDHPYLHAASLRRYLALTRARLRAVGVSV